MKIALKIPAFQVKVFDDENECKIERMNCLKKFKIKHYDNLQTTQPQEEERSVETSSTPITKPIPENIYAFKPKKPDLELSNSSTMLIALFRERGNLSKHDKYRKQLKENKQTKKNIII